MTRYKTFLYLLCFLCSLSLSAATTETRVADAAAKGDKDAVRSLIKQAVDVNAAQGDGMTALHWAALNGDAELAQMLLYAGASVKATTRLGGYNPLYMAAKSGHVAVIDTLLNAGADANGTALDGLTPLMMAASSGNPDAVEALVKRGANVNAKESENGQTPLAFAAAFNRSEVILSLLRHGANIDLASKVQEPPKPANRGNQNGQGNNNNQAAANNNNQAAGAQQAAGGRGGRGGGGGGQGGRGAQARQGAASSNGGRGDAQAAANAPAGQRGAAPQDANGAQPPAAADDTAAAAAQAAQNNGNDANGRGGGNPKGGLTPLMYAVRQGNLEATQTLVNHGAGLNALSADKSTALLLATINGHFDIAKFLVERGADVNIASMDGAMPLYGVVNTQWARKSFYPQPTTKYEKTSYLDLLKVMLEHGADPNVRLTKELWYSEYDFSLESSSQIGTTAFWKCAEVGDLDGMRLLVSYGADPNIGNKDGVTPLLMASGSGTHGNDDVMAPSGRLTAVKYLVEVLHADVNAADTAGATAAPAAAPAATAAAPANGQPAPAATQAEATAPATPPPAQQAAQGRGQQQQGQQQQGQQQGGGRNRDGGYTALHNAAARGDNAMILYLISKGARIDAVSKNGVTVADMANGPRQRIQPYPETVALLEILGSKNSHKCVSC
jgi:ankyrin repeat protein